MSERTVEFSPGRYACLEIHPGSMVVRCEQCKDMTVITMPTELTADLVAAFDDEEVASIWRGFLFGEGVTLQGKKDAYRFYKSHETCKSRLTDEEREALAGYVSGKPRLLKSRFCTDCDAEDENTHHPNCPRPYNPERLKSKPTRKQLKE